VNASVVRIVSMQCINHFSYLVFNWRHHVGIYSYY